MCITITVSERGRRVMGLSTTVINTVLVTLAIVLFVCALLIRYRLDARVEILGGYSSNALPVFLMVVAFFMLVVHLVAAKFCFEATYVETRSEKHHLFVAVIIVLMVFSVLTLISLIVMAIDASRIRSALGRGITKTMKAYKAVLDDKVRMDLLQIDFQCCGAKSYEDWFTIPWVNMLYVNVDSEEVKPYLQDGELVKDDVPFSCCSREAKRACVHHSVNNKFKHGNYDSITLNDVGCTDAMMSYFKRTIISPAVILLVVVLFLQIGDVIVMRLLQTSILTADEMNDPEGATAAYCIKGLGGGGDVSEYFKRKKDEETDETDISDESDEEDEVRVKKARRRRKKAHVYEEEEADDEYDIPDEAPRWGASNARRRFSGYGGERDDDDDGGGHEKEKKEKKDKKAKDKEGEDGKGKGKDGKDKKGKDEKDDKAGKDKKGAKEKERGGEKKGKHDRDKSKDRKDKKGKEKGETGKKAKDKKRGERGTKKDKKKTTKGGKEKADKSGKKKAKSKAKKGKASKTKKKPKAKAKPKKKKPKKKKPKKRSSPKKKRGRKKGGGGRKGKRR